MKQILISTFSLLLLSGVSQAQTLEAPDVNPLGVSFTNGLAETFPVGEEGENMVWDYTTFMPIQTINADYWPTSTSPWMDDYPEAEFVIYNGQGSYFYSFGPEYFEYFGGEENGVSYPLDDSQRFFPYPFSYGETFQDSTYAVLNIQGVDTYRKGEAVSEYNGYGSVLHPAGIQMDNISRITTHRTLQDSTAEDIVSITIDLIMFIQDTIAVPIIQHSDVLVTLGVEEVVYDTIFADTLELEVDTILVDTILPTVIYEYSIVEVLQSMSNGAEEIEMPEFAMFPNPASEGVTMTWSVMPDAIEFRDISGRLVHTEYAIPGLNSTRVDVSSWARGVYTTTVIVGDKQSSKQLILK